MIKTIRIASARPGHKSHSGNRAARSNSHSQSRGHLLREERKRDRRQTFSVRMDDPDQETLRAYIREQTCWWCGAGPFKSVAGHVRYHGIDRHELRELAGVFKQTSIASEELHDRMAEIMKGRAPILPPRAQKEKRVMSTAGRASMMERLKMAWEPSIRQAVGLRAGLTNSRPHKCTNPVCSNIVPRATRKTCSPECRKQVRINTQLKSALTQRRPHPCPICGVIVPISYPKTCSPTCARRLQHRSRAYHTCSMCGNDTGHHKKRTCSPECLTKARRRQGQLYSANLHTSIQDNQKGADDGQV